VQTGKSILSICTCLVRRQDESLVLQKLKNASFKGSFNLFYVIIRVAICYS